jgi:hypothetical protein
VEKNYEHLHRGPESVVACAEIAICMEDNPHRLFDNEVLEGTVDNTLRFGSYGFAGSEYGNGEASADYRQKRHKVGSRFQEDCLVRDLAGQAIIHHQAQFFW